MDNDEEYFEEPIPRVPDSYELLLAEMADAAMVHDINALCTIMRAYDGPWPVATLVKRLEEEEGWGGENKPDGADFAEQLIADLEARGFIKRRQIDVVSLVRDPLKAKKEPK